MKKAGWCDVRLLGLTDVIGDQDDVPRDAFEQTAANKLGETSCEEVLVKDGKRYLRVATSSRRLGKLRDVPREFQGRQGRRQGLIVYGAHD
jgi:hypothetical protein